MRKLRCLFLVAALGVAFLEPTHKAQATGSAGVPDTEDETCVLLECQDYGTMTCCSYECHPGGDYQDCWWW